MRPRKLTRCRVPGHGTRCGPSRERERYFARPTEKRIALRLEDALTQSSDHGDGRNPS